MSSWLPAPIKRPPYKAPEGIFVKTQEPATIVTAYYEMPSKYPKENYRIWIRNYLDHLHPDTPIIFFTESEVEPFLIECSAKRTRTKIIVKPKSAWTANTIPQAVWDDLHRKDYEANLYSSEIYKIWYEKPFFVRDAMEQNPFATKIFVWTDAGICRSEALAKLIPDFPQTHRIPTNRIMLLSVMPFTSQDRRILKQENIEILGGVEDRPRLGAGIIAGYKASWEEYINLFNTVVEKYQTIGAFWGKEQTIMRTMVLENPSKFSLIEVKPICPESWFYSLLYLGCSERLFKSLTDNTKNNKRISYEQMLKM